MGENGCRVTACICAYNAAARLPLALGHLRCQEGMSADDWDVLVVDNRSSDATARVAREELGSFPCRARVVREETPGLNYARRRGALEATGDVLVYVDDDNLLATDFLMQCVQFFRDHPRAGVVGGRISPRFDGCERPEYWDHVRGLVATNEDAPSHELLLSGAGEFRSLPCGAGMAVRRDVVAGMFRDEQLICSDRCGASLASSGDFEVGYRIVERGWEAWHCGALELEHVMTPARLDLAYLLRLWRSIQASNALFHYVVVEGNEYPPRLLVAGKSVWWYVRKRLADGTLLRRTRGIEERLRKASVAGEMRFRWHCLWLSLRCLLTVGRKSIGKGV